MSMGEDGCGGAAATGSRHARQLGACVASRLPTWRVIECLKRQSEWMLPWPPAALGR